MAAKRATHSFQPEVLEAGGDLELAELVAPLLLQEAQTVIVTPAIVLKPRAGVVTEISFIKIGAVRSCQSFPVVNFYILFS